MRELKLFMSDQNPGDQYFLLCASFISSSYDSVLTRQQDSGHSGQIDSDDEGEEDNKDECMSVWHH